MALVKVTSNRCFVLWTEDKRGNVRYDPTIFSTAAGAINEGERQVAKGMIKDYNYSVIMAPDIGAEQPKIKLLTEPATQPSISL